MSYSLRPFTDADYPAIVAIHNHLYPDDATTVAEMVHQMTKVFDERQFYRVRLVAEDAHGQVIAFGSLHHVIHEHHPDRLEMAIEVDPASQGKGVGTSLYVRLLATAQERGASSIRAYSWEAHEETSAFLQKRGFQEMKRDLESALDLAAFDFAPFAGAEERVVRQSIVITTLSAELASQPDALHRLHALCSACELDVPSAHPPTPLAFDAFVQMSVAIPTALHDAFFIARDGADYVGMTALYQHPGEADVLYQGLTGVARSHRGRGIALALKLNGIRYARERHYRQIRTDNDATNVPMLSINVALGFRRRPAWIEWQKALV